MNESVNEVGTREASTYTAKLLNRKNNQFTNLEAIWVLSSDSAWNLLRPAWTRLECVGESKDLDQPQNSNHPSLLSRLHTILQDLGVECLGTGSLQLQPGSSNIRTEKQAQRSQEDEENDSGADNGDNPTKQQKLVETDMPWFNPNGDTSINFVHPNSQETRRLL
ncbi:hypothetical protein BYT27DRAFT_7212736 [Phlegmacium glaucopus]|nr:hypothetical protein BYT27DRAFT_7212736 [Phlegmacium glaucopus]